MKLILVLMFVLFPITAAQVINIDSLKTLSKQLDDTSEKVEILNTIANECRKNSNFDEALLYANSAFNLAVELDDQVGISKANSFIGLIYRDQSDYEIAFQYFIRALEIASEIEDKIQIAYTHNNMGTIQIIRSNYTEAMTNLISGLKIFEEINNEIGVAYTSLNIARLLIKQNRPDEALIYLSTVLDIRKKLNDYLGLSRAYQYMAEAYSVKSEYRIASEYLELTEEMLDLSGIKNPAFYAAVKIQMGENLFKQYKFEQAADIYLEAIPSFKESGDKNNLASTYIKLAEIYLNLNYLGKAKQYIDLGFNLATELELKRIVKSSYKAYSDYNFKLFNYKESLIYFMKYSKLKDDILNETKAKQIQELKIQYETEKTIKENKNLKTEILYKEQNNLYLIIIVVLSIIVLAVTLLNYFSKSRTNKELQELIHTKDRFFTIISHDLRNPFGAIMNNTALFEAHFDDLSDEEKREMLQLIDNSTKKVYELLDNLLNWARSQKDELVIKKVKINLSSMLIDLAGLVENSVNEKNIVLNLVLDETIHLFADKNTISSVLQNLVSNAIKFTPEKGKITIRTSRENGKAKIEISDTGIGMDDDSLSKLFRIDFNVHRNGTNGEPGSGLGLILCKEFVDKNHGEISVISEVNEGSTFTLIFPTVRT